MKKMKTVMLSLAFATLTSLTAFAAEKTGWSFENGDWYFYDKDGDVVENAWETNDEGTYYFYLNEDGVMETSTLIEDSDYLYYVNEDGVQSRNKWRLLETEDEDEAKWYYFDAKGRSVKGKKVIDDKTYYFDKDGKMLYGWVTVSTDSDATPADNWKDGNMYLGDNTTGWRYESAWYKETDLEDEDVNVDHYWFYFKSNGEKVVDNKNKVRIDDLDYMFGETGIMVENDFADREGETYFASESGRVYKNRWIWIEDEDAENGGYWYYASKNGKILKNGEHKIDDKFFLFDATGKMLDGFRGDTFTASNASFLDVKSEEFAELASYRYYTTYGNKLKDDTIELELEDGFFTFGFDKNGMSLEGIVDKLLYKNGILQKATDEKYAVIEYGKKLYIVNASGKVMTGKDYTVDDVEYVKVENTENEYKEKNPVTE